MIIEEGRRGWTLRSTTSTLLVCGKGRAENKPPLDLMVLMSWSGNVGLEVLKWIVSKGKK